MVTVGLKLNPYPLKSQWRKVESVVLEGVLASPIGSNFEEYLSEERQKKKGKFLDRGTFPYCVREWSCVPSATGRCF